MKCIQKFVIANPIIILSYYCHDELQETMFRECVCLLRNFEICSLHDPGTSHLDCLLCSGQCCLDLISWTIKLQYAAPSPPNSFLFVSPTPATPTPSLWILPSQYLRLPLLLPYVCSFLPMRYPERAYPTPTCFSWVLSMPNRNILSLSLRSPLPTNSLLTPTLSPC